MALAGGGLRLVSIVDDGKGMSREDAFLAMTRHATSKLRDLDGLQSLLTMGFRGEALPAIASVSRFSLVTSERDADIHQLVWMIDGVMEIGHGSEQWQLNPGDCLAMRLDAPIRFHNPGARPARYLVALTGARKP